jgi:hypothetical protein
MDGPRHGQVEIRFARADLPLFTHFALFPVQPPSSWDAFPMVHRQITEHEIKNALQQPQFPTAKYANYANNTDELSPANGENHLANESRTPDIAS